MHFHAMQLIFSSLFTQGYILSTSPNEMDQLVGLAYEDYSFMLPRNSTTPSVALEETHADDAPNMLQVGRIAGLERPSGAETAFAGC